VAKDAAIPGFDAVQSSGRRVGEYQQGVETSSWKAGAPVKGQGCSGNFAWLPHQAEPEGIEAQVRSFAWWDLGTGNLLVGGGR
jgi:hypothetical protein